MQYGIPTHGGGAPADITPDLFDRACLAYARYCQDVGASRQLPSRHLSEVTDTRIALRNGAGHRVATYVVGPNGRLLHWS